MYFSHPVESRPGGGKTESAKYNKKQAQDAPGQSHHQKVERQQFPSHPNGRGGQELGVTPAKNTKRKKH